MLAFVGEMDLGASEGHALYVCPMHPDVTSESADRCPRCGMKLAPADLVAEGSHGTHDHHHHGGGEAAEAHDHAHGSAQGIEWEDDMVEVNRLTTPEDHALVADRPGDGGSRTRAIDWRVPRRGTR